MLLGVVMGDVLQPPPGGFLFRPHLDRTRHTPRRHLTAGQRAMIYALR
jgi:hypothetical protein